MARIAEDFPRIILVPGLEEGALRLLCDDECGRGYGAHEAVELRQHRQARGFGDTIAVMLDQRQLVPPEGEDEIQALLETYGPERFLLLLRHEPHLAFPAPLA